MIFMLVFLLFTAAGIITARYFKKRNPKWLKYHRLLMISGLTASVMGIGWIAFVVQVEAGVHFRIPHAYLGIGTFLVTLTAPILGYKYTSRKIKKDMKSTFRRLHKISGRVSLALLIITIMSGLIQFGILSFPFL
jgi:hypothetical protein